MVRSLAEQASANASRFEEICGDESALTATLVRRPAAPPRAPTQLRPWAPLARMAKDDAISPSPASAQPEKGQPEAAAKNKGQPETAAKNAEPEADPFPLDLAEHFHMVPVDAVPHSAVRVGISASARKRTPDALLSSRKVNDMFPDDLENYYRTPKKKAPAKARGALFPDQ
jgi:hypothetical protein